VTPCASCTFGRFTTVHQRSSKLFYQGVLFILIRARSPKSGPVAYIVAYIFT